MNVWLTPQQIATMRLAGMPTHEVSVRRMCQKNLLVYRSKERGKGIEIALSSLPPVAQQDYMARQAAQAAASVHAVLPAPTFSAPSGDSIPAGVPSPADISPAATVAGGVTGAGGAGRSFAVGDDVIVPQGHQPVRAATAAADAGNGQLTRGAGSIPVARTTHSSALAGGAACPAVSSSTTGLVPGLPAVAASSGAAGVFSAPKAGKDGKLIEAARRKMIIAPILRGEIKGRAAIAQQAKAHGTTAATLYRWVAAWRHGGDAGLVDRDRSDKGQARVIVSPAWETFMRGAGVSGARMLEIAGQLAQTVRGLWAQHGKPSWHQVAGLAATTLIAATVEAAGCTEGVAKRVCRLSRRFVEGERRYSLVALKDRDGKGFYDRTPSVIRSRAALKPGECVFGDVSPADIPVLRPDGEIAWARLIAWQDAATNMLHITGHLPGKGAGVRREHVALSFTAMCQSAPWGMPKRLYLDNGPEYSWPVMLDAWAELTRLTGGVFGGVWDAHAAGEQFGIVTRSIPFKPRAKLIEGAFSNLLNFMAWHPCFSGSDRMCKKIATLGKGVKAVPVEDLKAFLAEAVAAYNAMPQGGHLGGKSPAEKMAEFLADGFQPFHADAEVMGFAFGETFEAKCRMGQIRVGGITYYDKQLIAYDGEKLDVRWARHAPDVAFAFRGSQLLAAATPMPIFAWGDPEGAKLAGRLAAEAREVVEVMRGQVAWLDPRELLREFARLGGAAQVVEEAGRRAARIGLTPEAQAAADARRAALEAALAQAAPRNPDLVANRHGVVDEEADAVRQWLEA